MKLLITLALMTSQIVTFVGETQKDTAFMESVKPMELNVWNRDGDLMILATEKLEQPI